jgi:NAD dependent epimerase/dehydratase family enzyme
MLLSSARVKPAKLVESGYEFRDMDLEACLRRLLSST